MYESDCKVQMMQIICAFFGNLGLHDKIKLGLTRSIAYFYLMSWEFCIIILLFYISYQKIIQSKLGE